MRIFFVFGIVLSLFSTVWTANTRAALASFANGWELLAPCHFASHAAQPQQAASPPNGRYDGPQPIDFAAQGYAMRYHLASDYDHWPADKRRRVVEAMNSAMRLYNQMGVFPKEVTAAYRSETPTADGSYNGNIRFGGSINARVALHELGHVLGIGTHPKWHSFIKDRQWTGTYANAQLQAFDGPNAVLHVDGAHFWPYGMNYDRESSPENDRRHVLMLAAFRRDLGLVASQPIRGMVGVGTYATQAEFKNIRVLKGNQILYASDFAKGLQALKPVNGTWKIVDGALRQTSEEPGARVLVGDPSWSDYTITLQARKLSGKEGFLILFGVPDEQTKSWWNLGGWDNTRHGLQLPDDAPPSVAGQIEKGRWYDIKVEVRGATVKTYLDGTLIQQATQ